MNNNNKNTHDNVNSNEKMGQETPKSFGYLIYKAMEANIHVIMSDDINGNCAIKLWTSLSCEETKSILFRLP